MKNDKDLVDVMMNAYGGWKNWRKFMPDTDELHHHGPYGSDSVPFPTYTLYINRRWVEGSHPRNRAIGRYCVYCGLIPTERTMLLKKAADATVRDAERRYLRKISPKKSGTVAA